VSASALVLMQRVRLAQSPYRAQSPCIFTERRVQKSGGFEVAEWCRGGAVDECLAGCWSPVADVSEALLGAETLASTRASAGDVSPEAQRAAALRTGKAVRSMTSNTEASQSVLLHFVSTYTASHVERGQQQQPRKGMPRISLCESRTVVLQVAAVALGRTSAARPPSPSAAHSVQRSASSRVRLRV
jgi:hypothetical protein